MKRVGRWLLYGEVLICFGPSLVTLLYGLIILPTWVDLYLSEPEEPNSGVLLSILFTVAGVVGTIGILACLFLIRGWRPPLIVVRAIQVAAAIGALAIALFAAWLGLFSVWDPAAIVPIVFTVLLPLACAAHLVYLARREFFQ